MAERKSLSGTVALITGASSGIGRATSFALARAGARLVLIARRADLLTDVTEEIRARGGTAEPFPGDVTEPGVMAAGVEAAMNRFGRLDVLVNNAGAGFFGSIEQTTEQDLETMLAINLKSTFYGIKAALTVMRQQRAGHIINVASTAGRRGSPYVGAYCASKFAVVGLSESLRVELLGSGIHVSLICPGATKTEFFAVARRRTCHHQGLVGPVESSERVAERIVTVVKHPHAEVLAQPVRRKAFLILNLLAPEVVDRLLARLIDG